VRKTIILLGVQGLPGPHIKPTQVVRIFKVVADIENFEKRVSDVLIGV